MLSIHPQAETGKLGFKLPIETFCALHFLRISLPVKFGRLGFTKMI